jgi:DNA-binding SARP family transcriptional activator
VLYTQNRTEQRKFLASAWQKFINQQPLDPLEAQLTQVIELHPEYHALIQNIEADYFVEQGEANPFLHLNLHLSLREQLSINQPPEVQKIYQQLLVRTKNPHETEHKMMDCIAEMIFSSQKNQTPMNFEAYLTCLKSHLR